MKSITVWLRLDASDRSDRAVAAVLRGLLETIESNLEGAIDGSDPEALHDLRVSVRRSRAVQREFKRVFPARELREFRKGFRWLQRVTGPARDLDVQVAELDVLSAAVPEALRPDLERLRELLEARRQTARAEMAHALRSDRAVALLARWGKFLDGLSQSPRKGRPDAKRAVGRVAGRRIRKVYRRMVKRGRRIGPGSPSEPYHELRKQGKELRYLLELFGTPLYPSKHVKPMIKALKGLQDALGRHQDREAQIEMLNRVGAEAARNGAAPVSPELIQLLVEQLVADKLAARGAFAPQFKAFARPKRRRLAKRFR